MRVHAAKLAGRQAFGSDGTALRMLFKGGMDVDVYSGRNRRALG